MLRSRLHRRVAPTCDLATDADIVSKDATRARMNGMQPPCSVADTKASPAHKGDMMYLGKSDPSSLLHMRISTAACVSLVVKGLGLTGSVWLHAVSLHYGDTRNTVIVVGAGIAGLSAAASLHKVTYQRLLL